jgi:hypothetical protein
MAHCAAQPIQGFSETGALFLGGRLVTTVATAAVNATLSWFKGGTWTKGSNGEYTLQLEAQYRGPTTTGGLLTFGLTKAGTDVSGLECLSKDFKAGTYVFRFTETAVAGAGTDPAEVSEIDVLIVIFNTTNPKG